MADRPEYGTAALTMYGGGTVTLSGNNTYTGGTTVIDGQITLNRSGGTLADSAPLTVKLLKNGRLITYKDFPHGSCQTHPDIINADLLAFIRGDERGAERDAAPIPVAEPVTA